MAGAQIFTAGGYRYLPSVFQYSGGVAAEPGFTIERVRLRRPVSLGEGFDIVERHLAAIGRPLTAFCACELRSPAPFSEGGFVSFNQEYVQTLERWGIYRDGVNPVARTNVAPLIDPPTEVSLFAFSYTTPVAIETPAFIVAGGGEAAEGKGDYRERIVGWQDLSPEGMRAKVTFVIAAMTARLDALGFAWADATDANAYTVHNFGSLVPELFGEAGLIPNGLTWQLCRPPVIDIEFEMDVHGPGRQLVLG